MSVQVHISIGDGNTSRHLSIDLQGEPSLDADGHRDLTEVGEYAVVFSGGGWSRRPRSAEFHHRYGDDVLALITSAIAALRREGVDQA